MQSISSHIRATDLVLIYIILPDPILPIIVDISRNGCMHVFGIGQSVKIWTVGLQWF